MCPVLAKCSHSSTARATRNGDNVKVDTAHSHNICMHVFITHICAHMHRSCQIWQRSPYLSAIENTFLPHGGPALSLQYKLFNVVAYATIVWQRSLCSCHGDTELQQHRLLKASCIISWCVDTLAFLPFSVNHKLLVLSPLWNKVTTVCSAVRWTLGDVITIIDSQWTGEGTLYHYCLHWMLFYCKSMVDWIGEWFSVLF